MNYPVITVVLFATIGFSAQAELILPKFHTNVEIYRVFGAEHPGPYKHPAAITQLENGDLYIAYYGGANEYDKKTAVYGSRRCAGESVWSTPVSIASTPFQGVGNPVIWQAPDGVVWLFYNNQHGDTWSSARVQAKISEDGARTWSDSFMLVMEEGSMVRGQPIVLNNGDYLLPLYNETGGDRERSDNDTCSYFLRYDPKTQKWQETNRIHSPEGNLQAQAVQLSDTELFCFMRRGGGYEATDNGWMLRSNSSDGGYTWTDAKRTAFPNPNSAIELLKLHNGNLLLVYNDNMNDRTPLTVAVSTDQGKTWPHKRAIAGGKNSYAYPYAVQGKDEKVYLVYTTNNRTTIMMAVFEEAAITEYTD
ncbi:MAG: exo-alpha-sialidase [Candidatus Hydrogenedentes bacterium]|nr:exo-alpha-sialidase [Candidatus Hydrogenedentota bacterium]